jgi:hypothetical protein
MTDQPRQDMIAVLPDSFRNHERRMGVDFLENIHTHALT